MKKAIAHLRSNVVGYLALFVALGGTSYAAVSIPANSVGSRQLRDGAVIQKKIGKQAVGRSQLDPRSIAGSIVFWARVSSDGVLLGSSRPATVAGWAAGGGDLIFHGTIPANCFPLANVSSPPGGYVATAESATQGGNTAISLSFAQPTQAFQAAVDVAEICP